MTREAIGARRAVHPLAGVGDAAALTSRTCPRGDAIRRLAREAQVDAADRQRPDRAGDGRAAPATSRRPRYLQRRVSRPARTARPRPSIARCTWSRSANTCRSAACCFSSARWSKPCRPSRPAPRPTLLPVDGPHGQHGDLLRGDLRRPDALVRDARQRAADDDHQRRVVRPVVGRLQHWEQASLRAIEQGRYLARAANTGISGFVDPYGRVMQRLEHVPERGAGRGPPLPHRPHDLQSASATSWAGCRVALTARGAAGDPPQGKIEPALARRASSIAASRIELMATLQHDEQLRRYQDLASAHPICGAIFDAARPADELTKIEQQASDPDFWKDQAGAQKLLQRRRRLEDDVSMSESLKRARRRPGRAGRVGAGR